MKLLRTLIITSILKHQTGKKMKNYLKIFVFVIVISWVLSSKFYYENLNPLKIKNNSKNSLSSGHPIRIDLDKQELLETGKVESKNNFLILFRDEKELLQVPVYTLENTETFSIWFPVQDEIPGNLSDDRYYVAYSTKIQATSNFSLEISSTSTNKSWEYENFDGWDIYSSPNQENMIVELLPKSVLIFDPADGKSAIGQIGIEKKEDLKVETLDFSGSYYFQNDMECGTIINGWANAWETDPLITGITHYFEVKNLSPSIINKYMGIRLYVKESYSNIHKNYLEIEKLKLTFFNPPEIFLKGEEVIGGIEKYKYYRVLSVRNYSDSKEINGGYYIYFEFDTEDLINQGKLQKDCNDLSIFFYDPDLESWVQIERLVVNPNSSTTKIWFRNKYKISPGNSAEYRICYKTKMPICNQPQLNLPFSDGSDNYKRIYCDKFYEFKELTENTGWVTRNNTNLIIRTKTNTEVSGIAGYSIQNAMEISNIIITGKVNFEADELTIKVIDKNDSTIHNFTPGTYQYFYNLNIEIDSEDRDVLIFKAEVLNPNTIFSISKGLYVAEIQAYLINPPETTVNHVEYENELYQENETEETVQESEKIEFKVINNVYGGEFKDQVIIKGYVPDTRMIKISVYSITGYMEEEIVNELKSGEFEIRWKPDDLSTGIYYLVLQTGTELFKRQVLILR